MSNLTFQQPIQHIPSFNKYKILRSDMVDKLEGVGVEPLRRDVPLDGWLYFSDMEGWGKILYNLMFKSSLYKPDIFNCDKYALKAYIVCCERYDMNTFLFVIGNMPQGRHGFNIFYYGDGFMLWEPNEGFEFSGSAFEIGEYGYQPDTVLV